MENSGTTPVFRASSALIGGAEALELFRGSVQDIFQVRQPDGIPADAFRLDMIATHLGHVLLSAVHASALIFERGRQLVATTGIDHILVQLYTSGGYAGLAGERGIRVREGDICVLDLTGTLETQASDFGNITLVIPRPLLAEAVDNIDRLHGLVLTRELPVTRILAAYIRTLIDQADFLSLGDADIVGRGAIALIGRMLEGQSSGAELQRVAVTPLRRVLDHIDANLHDPALGPGHLIERFGLSRAKLYRMFGGVGGVAEVIRLRRLNGAAMELASATAQDRRISEIARRWGFADDNSFGRAFRAHYGITPTDARTRSGEIWSKIHGWRADAVVGSESAEISFWLRTLRS